MDYKELIKITEEKRNKLYIKYRKTIFFKSLYKLYLNKYDALLIDLYTKYEKSLSK